MRLCVILLKPQGVRGADAAGQASWAARVLQLSPLRLGVPMGGTEAAGLDARAPPRVKVRDPIGSVNPGGLGGVERLQRLGDPGCWKSVAA